LFLLPSAAAGIGSGGKFKAVENVWYLGQNNNAAVNAALVIWWLLTVGAYCYLWYRGAIKQSSRTAATFSIAQQAIQSGITCGCRAIFFAYAVFQLAVWSEILNTPAKGWGPEHVDVGTGEMFIETLLAAFSVGAVVAAIAALVRYASTEPNTKP
jgi:hypothetical protein